MMLSTTARSINLVKKAKIKGIKSTGSIRNYQACIKLFLDWCLINSIPPERASSLLILEAYLGEKSEVYKQKTLDQHRMALNFAYSKKLKFVKSLLDTVLNTRAYSLNQVAEITNEMEEQNTISILLCYFCGLRAHELCTLQRFDEGERTDTRTWSSELFQSIDNFSIYLVSGKGGLIRQVAIPNELVVALEKFRLDVPRKIRDRKIFYYINYDIPYGHKLSQRFSRASFSKLGFSNGLHGLRHSYTKNRIRTLLKVGFDYEDAKLIVSQEIGHFRASIIGCYMR